LLRWAAFRLFLLGLMKGIITTRRYLRLLSQLGVLLARHPAGRRPRLP
jgi:hypothetical protein